MCHITQGDDTNVLSLVTLSIFVGSFASDIANVNLPLVPIFEFNIFPHACRLYLKKPGNRSDNEDRTRSLPVTDEPETNKSGGSFYFLTFFICL